MRYLGWLYKVLKAQWLIIALCLMVGKVWVDLNHVNSGISELKRLTRNTEELMDCDPSLVARVKPIIHDLEKQGYKPYIRQGWRSPQSQLQAFAAGKSEVKFGFHNVSGPRGERRGFALDIIENPKLKVTTAAYAVNLAILAKKQNLTTGIYWSLTDSERKSVQAAIDGGKFDSTLKLGWDPCHLEPNDMSLAEAQNVANQR